MSEHSIFETEDKIVTNAEGILERENDSTNPLFDPFSGLLKSYKKIFRQLKRLIKLSDKQQLKLNQLNESLEVENYELVLELGQAFESFVRALTTTVDAKHPITAGHSHRVTEYSLFLGKQLGLSDNNLEVLKYAALLHDIGKIGVPDAVLTKKGRFTDEERLIMNEHSAWTYKILSAMRLPNMLKNVPKMAACHHEKLNGTGYPYRLRGNRIPKFSKILAVGDVFDALTSLRDYPKYDGKQTMGMEAMPIEKALSILDKDKGTHFDPDIVNMALKKADSLAEYWQKFHKR
ncbi:HD-GYP domain-containing protein [bacterium]|nr:HD-GYP domain-containing protein [bacterium]